ncbi:MAG: hypothetical protein D6780_01615 [Candidatus Dadabacteria bacterium]|nr:MAG: hypothetical protein D6780_01615 [Candidatus Dadabacteria bacterium]
MINDKLFSDDLSLTPLFSLLPAFQDLSELSNYKTAFCARFDRVSAVMEGLKGDDFWGATEKKKVITEYEMLKIVVDYLKIIESSE